MYTIQPSISDEAQEIAKLLSLHYSECNTHFSKNLYLTDQEKLTKYVTLRLQEPSSAFSYFSLKAEWKFVGFVNTLTEQNHGEILILLTSPDYTNNETTNLLLNYAISFLHSKGKTDVRLETYVKETVLINALEERGATQYTSKRFL